MTVVSVPLVSHMRTRGIDFATGQHAVVCPVVVTCATLSLSVAAKFTVGQGDAEYEP